MRSIVLTAAMAATMLLAVSASAQEDAPPEAPAPAAPAEAVKTPDHPIPYTALQPKPKPKAEKKPAPSAAAAKPMPVAAATKPVIAEAAAPPRPLPGARLQPGQPLPPADLAGFVDGVVAQAMASQHVPGVTVAVVQNGGFVLKKGYGFARLSPDKPVDVDRTLFRLGPVSQAFTWIGIMKAVEAGRMNLDAPVAAYLPKPLQPPADGYDAPIRLRDLMSHSAGYEERVFGHLVERDADYVRPLELYLRRERPRRVAAPGAVSSFSSYGAGLAGQALAQSRGDTFERLMERDIFVPLRLRRTTFREPRPLKAMLPAPMPDALAADTADGFRWRDGGFERQPYAYAGQLAPAASASSTATDMGRLMLAILGGGQLEGAVVYGPKTSEALHTPLLRTPPGINGWAHGLAVESLPGGRSGYGGSGGLAASAAHMVVIPELNLGVFVAANSAEGEALARALPAAIVAEFYAPPEPFPRRAAGLGADAPAFAGSYLSTRRASGGLEGFVGRLLGALDVRISPAGRLVTEGLGDAPQGWTADGSPGEGRFVSPEGTDHLAFRLQDGRATSFQTDAGTEVFERVGFWRSLDALALLAALTGAAAAVSLIGMALRDRREVRESQIQSRAGLVQNIQAALWLLSLGFFLAWRRGGLDATRLTLEWPGALLVTASACALVAGALTVTTLVALPAVWRGGRRVESWTGWRKLAFTFTVLVYAVFTVLLARAGALSPWAG